MVCREFQIVSYMEAHTGKDEVTVCERKGGIITVKSPAVHHGRRRGEMNSARSNGNMKLFRQE
jgi:hypothetical protein